MGARQPAGDRILVLYDGVCGLCNGLVRFLIARDRRDRLRFAPLQSELGRAIVLRHGGDPAEISSMVTVLGHGGPDERVRWRSRAALLALASLGGPWRLVHGLRIFPRFVTDLGYALVARLRYRLFGRFDACPVPAPEHRAKFLDVA